MLSMSFVKTSSLLFCLLVSAQGLPRQEDNYAYYNDESDDYDYKYDDDVPVNDVDGTANASIHTPVIVSEPVQLNVVDGMTIRLPCIVDQLPGEISIIWSKEDKQKTTIAIGTNVIPKEYKNRANVHVDEKGSVLTIGIAKSEDAGEYKCSVAVPVKGDSPEIKHTVSIRAPPSIEVTTPSVLEVMKGDDVTLNCKGSGSPKPTVKWSRVGEKNMPDGASEIESDSVTFSAVSRKHAGTYRCSASNGYGQKASKEVQVVVKYAPEVEVTEVFVHTNSGDKAEIVCQVHAVPKPTIVWSKDGKELSNKSQKVKIANLGSKHTLTIPSVEKEDFGKYTCQASNSLGSQQHVIEMTGHASPAEFKSTALGNKNDSYVVEWTSHSFTPIEDFLLEVKESGGEWKLWNVTPTKEGPFIFAGKEFLNELKPATPYSARVSAKNGEGWGPPGPVFNFATKGAVPSPAKVTAPGSSATSSSSSIMILLMCISMLILRMHH